MSPHRLTPDRLLVLHSIALAGSLTTAAAELSMSVSAVSQQLTKLEREVGLALVERLPRGVRLTDAGAALSHYAARIDIELAAAGANMEEFRRAERGSLTLATFPTFAASVMPEIIGAFTSQYRSVSLSVTSTRQAGIVDALLRREAGLGTVWDYPWMRFDHPDLLLSPLMVEPTMLLVPASHRLAGSKLANMADLGEEKWVTRTAHPVSSVLNKVCQDAGFVPRISMVTNDYQELQGMVAAGIGVALAPALAVQNPRPDLRVISIASDPAPRRILLAYHQHRFLDPTVRGAVRIFRKIAKDWIHGSNP